MKNITSELKSFFEATGLPQRQLAKMSGVSTATINRLVKGLQDDVRLSTANSLRDAMFSFQRFNPAPGAQKEEQA